MKKTLVSSVSLVLTFGMAVPALAYTIPGFTRIPHRVQVNLIKTSNDIRSINFRPARRDIRGNRKRSILKERKNSNRSTSVNISTTRKTHLERTTRKYNLRRDNRVRKPGSDRYRVLRPNTRYFRRQASSPTSYLPPMIVQTGGASSYDRPTRRDIRGGNGNFLNVKGRNRNILEEIRENSR